MSSILVKYMIPPFDKPVRPSWQGQDSTSLSNWFFSQAKSVDKRTPIQRLFGLGKKITVRAGIFPIPTLNISRKEYEQVSREILGHITEPPRFLGQGIEQAVFSIGANKVVKIGHGQFTTPPRIAQFLQPIQSGKSGNLFYHVMPRVKPEQFLENKYKDVTPGLSKRASLYERLQLKLLEDARTQGYTLEDAHSGNIAVIKRKLVITDWGFTTRAQKTKGIRVDLRDRIAKEGLNIQDVDLAQKVGIARGKKWFSQQEEIHKLIKEGKKKESGIAELRRRAAKLGREVQGVKAVMHGGEGSSRVGTGIYSALSRGVRRFKGI